MSILKAKAYHLQAREIMIIVRKATMEKIEEMITIITKIIIINKESKVVKRLFKIPKLSLKLTL